MPSWLNRLLRAFAPLRETLFCLAILSALPFQRHCRKLGPLPRPQRRRPKRRHHHPHHLGARQLSLETAAPRHRPQLARDLGESALSHVRRSRDRRANRFRLRFANRRSLVAEKTRRVHVPHQRSQQPRFEHARRRRRPRLRGVVQDGDVSLAAFTHAGNEVWRRNIGPFKEKHGFGKSPVVVDDLVYVSRTARPKAQSRPRSQDRRRPLDAAARPGTTAFSTPCLLDPNAKQKLLLATSTATGLDAIDALTGKVVWHGFNRLNPSYELRVAAYAVTSCRISGCQKLLGTATISWSSACLLTTGLPRQQER